MDNTYASTTQFGKRLVHGMLVGSLCSQLVGMYIPGRKCLYLKQQLVFKQPVFIGDTVVATGIVVSKSKSTRMLTISIKIRKNDSIVLEGEALVQVL
jgi:3-hydroxybutyryl-CoA dehydratase